MNRLLFLLLPPILFAPCCQDEEAPSARPAAEEPADKESPEKRSVARARLLQEKFALQQELESLLEKAELDPGERLQEITATIAQARTEFEELRKNHPRLQKLNQDVSLWQRKLTSATSTGNQTTIQQARAKLIDLRGKISQIAKSLPELANLEEAIVRSQKEAVEIRRSLAVETPDGRKLIERLEALEEKIETLSGPANADR